MNVSESREREREKERENHCIRAHNGCDASEIYFMLLYLASRLYNNVIVRVICCPHNFVSNYIQKVFNH